MEMEMEMKIKNNMKNSIKEALFLLCLAFCLSLSSCEIDNYAEPDGTLRGELIDSITRKPYISEQPNGFQISCVIQGWEGSATVGSQTFWGKANGTFNNSKIFAGVYNVYPQAGGFHTASVKRELLEIRSKQVTAHNFTVMPYVSFSDVSITKDPDVTDGIIATFTLNTNTLYAADTVRSVATFRDYIVFATDRTPLVGVNYYDAEVSIGPVEAGDGILGTPITVRKRGFKPNTTYYLRVGARCKESPNAAFNMTETVTLQF